MPAARALHPCVAVALLLATTAIGSAQTITKNPVCNGVFDFYFVLDTSGSVGTESFRSDVVSFVSNVTDNYVEPDFRVSFVTFSDQDKAIVHLNLTRIGDREEVKAGIERLKMYEVGGSTHLSPGLEKVNDQISRLGGDAASVILVVTDGILSDSQEAIIQANVARNRGATVFAIGVVNFEIGELVQIAGTSKRVYNGSDFEYLNQVIDDVVNATCIEIDSVYPSQACVGSAQSLTLRGRGFLKQLVEGRGGCRFKTVDGDTYLTPLVGMIRDDVVTCSTPNFNNTGSLVLQLTLNGITFISSNVTMEISSCEPVNGGLVAGILLGLIGLLALLALALLWFFCPLITGKVVGGLPPEEKKETPPRPPPPKGTPGKKWEVVDASYYGARGAGGIAPMKVRWGDKGATEEGNKLKKAKDAKVLKVEQKPGRPAPPQRPLSHNSSKGPGCWGRFKAKLARWYAVAASYRPVFTVHGSARKILWTRKAQAQAAKKPAPQRNANSV